MKFERFFEESSVNDFKIKVIGYLQRSCYESSCSGMECIDCPHAITDDITLRDLHNRIISVILNPDTTDKISIDKKVVETAIKNTIDSVESLKKRFKEAKELTLLQTSDEFIDLIQKNMGDDVDFQTVISLLKSID